MINKDNYFIESKGTFEAIVDTNLIKLALTFGRLAMNFQYKGKTYVFNFRSYNEKFKSESLYFLVDGETLVRVSDHWSNRIGSIALCEWYLDKGGDSTSFEAGTIKLLDLKI